LNVLFVTPRLPFPPDTGAKIRTFNLLKEVSRHCRVTLLSFYERPEDLKIRPLLETFCHKVLTVPNASYQKHQIVKGLARSLLDTRPYVIGKYWAPWMIEALRRCLYTAHYDLVHLDHLHMGQYVEYLNGVPCVIDDHNVEHRLWERYLKNENNPLKKLYITQQVRKMRHFEKKICQKATLCTAVSETDRDDLLKLAPKARVVVIPNGVDTEYFAPRSVSSSSPNVETSPHTLVFVGSMDWLPNDDAMIYFCQEIFPLVHKKIPEAKLYIVGRNPSKTVRSYQSERVIVIGAVEDVRPYLAQARIAIVPIRIGGGTRLKILEAMAMEKPVISTSVGAEGIEITPGKDIVIADDPMDFAKGVLYILKNPGAGVKLGENGRKLVKEKYDWKIIGNRLSMVYEDLTNPIPI